MPIAEPRFSWSGPGNWASGAGVWEGEKAASLCRGRSHLPRDGGCASRDRARGRWDGGCARRDWSHLAEPRGCALRGRSHSAEPGSCGRRGRSHSAEPGSCGRRGRSHLPEPPDSGRQPRARKREERGGKGRLPACFPRPSVCPARRRSRFSPPSARHPHRRARGDAVADELLAALNFGAARTGASERGFQSPQQWRWRRPLPHRQSGSGSPMMMPARP